MYKSLDRHNRCCGGRFWFVQNTYGICFGIFTWLLILFAEFVVMRMILMPHIHSTFGIVNIIIFQILAFLASASHVRSMFSDPGVVPRGNANKELIEQMDHCEGKVIVTCPKCCSIKPERAHHCSICQRCIRKMDHHCPWVNNCVGENNQKYFILFIFYIALISLHALFLVFTAFADCVEKEWCDCSPYNLILTILLLLGLTYEALLFAVFGVIMLGTQLTCILNDETNIEQLKKEEVRWIKKSPLKSLQSVFGRFSLAWLSPFSSPGDKLPLTTHLHYV